VTRVLVVDDSDTTRTLLVRTLERAGFAVSSARDGAEGAAAALREPPAVVVTDLDMPVMDGHQLLRLLKSEAATAATPIIVLTSHGEAPSRFWGLHGGADAYLTKDSDPAELVAAVGRLAAHAHPTTTQDGAASLGPLDVLTRVVRQLDASLMRATLLNALLEKGLSTTDLHAASNAILQVVASVADAHLLAVGVTEPDAATLDVLVARPVSLRATERFVSAMVADMAVPAGVAPDVAVNGESEGDGDADPAHIVSYPLPMRGAAGRLAVLPSEPQQFALASGAILADLAPHAGLVLDNARLGQRLQELSTHDGLTRALNHRAIQERLTQEIERAGRYSRTVTVVIGDLDHFKRVNDAHGHVAGDAVLRAAADAMRRALRTSDVLGRYGGEEFLAVLPESDLEAGRRAAERLRRAVAERTTIIASGERVPITASFGVASQAELGSGATADALVALADSRLYQAKAAGRNCVRP
jgi:two-component system, cell cycle response regulator